jgi:GPI mannosyltransferase 3
MKSFTYAFALATVVYIVAAVFSTGFFHPDEHFQIVEFAEYISGRNSAIDMAWEFEAQIRPAAQPIIAYLVISTTRYLISTDPYCISFILRLVAGALSLFAIRFFISTTKNSIPQHFRTYYYFLSYLLWFLPFANVRFSSECFSGLSALVAVAFVFSKVKHRYYFTGLFLGLAFIFRFQTAVLSIGFICWMYAIEKFKFKEIFKVLTGIFVIIIIGTILDSLFYGNFVITPLNYFRANIIDHVASNYGTAPWYFYSQEYYKFLGLPMSVAIVISLLIALFNYRSFLIWIILPFILIHIITPHKEVRFLFPLVNFLPLLMTNAFLALYQNQSSVLKFLKPTITFFAILLALINVIVLSFAIFSPADGIGRANMTSAIHHDYKGQQIDLWIGASNPYQPILLPQHFYEDKNVQIRLLDTAKTIPTNQSKKALFIVTEFSKSKYSNILLKTKLTIIKHGVAGTVVWGRNLLGCPTSPYTLYELEAK